MTINGCVVPFVVDLLVDRTLLDERDLTPITRKELNKIGDSATLAGVATAPDSTMEQIADAPTDDSLKTEDVNLGWKKTGDSFDAWEPTKVTKIKHWVSNNFTTVILGEDDLFSEYTLLEKITGMALRNRILLPLEDSKHVVKNDDVAAGILSDLKLEQGKALPVTYNDDDFNMVTDESFSRIFFYGMGSVLLAKQESVSDSEFGPFVVDMPLQDLEVRKLYRSLGARIHFTEGQVVSAIYDYGKETLYKPGDNGWSEAKLLAKVTAFTLMTAREHLVWTHLIVSNDVTRECIVRLPPSHPIRRLLTVFTFHSTEVNLAAFDSLVPNTSFLHRAVGFKYSAMKKIFDEAYTSSDIYQPFTEKSYNPALQKLADEGKFPYATQGCEYYEIVRSFVRKWLNSAGDAATDEHAKAFYSAMKESSKGQKYELPAMDDDAMVNLLSTVIFTVTAHHELIGNVVDYTLLPSRTGFRLTKEDPSEIDLQSFLIASIITASTSVEMPQLMSQFSNFFGKGGAPTWEVDVWKGFINDLEVQSKKVQAADKKRTVKFRYFDPKRFECSVSV